MALAGAQSTDQRAFPAKSQACRVVDIRVRTEKWIVDLVVDDFHFVAQPTWGKARCRAQHWSSQPILVGKSDLSRLHSTPEEMADMDVFAAMGIAGFGKVSAKKKLDPARFDKNKREVGY